MRAALFGGSFNPIHYGHIQIANEIINTGIADEVWIVPCGNHAFGKELARGNERLDMINIAFKNKNKIKCLDIEVNSKRKSCTSETLKKLKLENPEIIFYLVIGADNLNDIKRWNDYEYLKENAEFIIIKRPGFDIAQKIEIKICKIVNLSNNISSTLIRGNIIKNKPLGDLVPKEVEEYIRRRGLYIEI